ncbi:SRPBCC family protein [Leifsonia sp. McL0607]|uniref:SRPBCC family protein n=1 Tax=Leifsonia sp. McL0607 TaxID=3415672 RepID=UPI003CEE4C7B
MAGTVIVERTDTIRAPREAVQPLIAELPNWVEWSPWEGMDPGMKREYTGEPGTIGSTYSWNGNRKAGEGRMTITAVYDDGVGIDLDFTRPFRSSNHVRFVLTPEGAGTGAGAGTGTRVIWRMESPKTFFSRFFNLDKLVGADFEKGLRQLKQLVEAG